MRNMQVVRFDVAWVECNVSCNHMSGAIINNVIEAGLLYTTIIIIDVVRPAQHAGRFLHAEADRALSIIEESA